MNEKKEKIDLQKIAVTLPKEKPAAPRIDPASKERQQAMKRSRTL